MEDDIISFEESVSKDEEVLPNKGYFLAKLWTGKECNGFGSVVYFNVIIMPIFSVFGLSTLTKKDTLHFGLCALTNVTTTIATISVIAYLGHHHAEKLLTMAFERLDITGVSEVAFNATRISLVAFTCIAAAYTAGIIVSNIMGAIVLAVREAQELPNNAFFKNFNA